MIIDKMDDKLRRKDASQDLGVELNNNGKEGLGMFPGTCSESEDSDIPENVPKTLSEFLKTLNSSEREESLSRKGLKKCE